MIFLLGFLIALTIGLTGVGGGTLTVPVLVLAERSMSVPQDVRNVTTVVPTRGMSKSKLVRAVETIFETRIPKSMRRGAASA